MHDYSDTDTDDNFDAPDDSLRHHEFVVAEQDAGQRLDRFLAAQFPDVSRTHVQTLIDAGFTPEESKTVKIQKGKGCGVCNNTGYKGRCGLYEVMEVDDEIRELVLVGASAVELKKKAIERGMITLRRSGLIKVAAGMTTLEEVARETIH